MYWNLYTLKENKCLKNSNNIYKMNRIIMIMLKRHKRKILSVKISKMTLEQHIFLWLKFNQNSMIEKIYIEMNMMKQNWKNIWIKILKKHAKLWIHLPIKYWFKTDKTILD